MENLVFGVASTVNKASSWRGYTLARYSIERRLLIHSASEPLEHDSLLV